MENKKIIDSLTKYGRDFQIKCISCLISDRSFIERISDIIEVDFFESDANKWVVKESIKYFNEYKDLPTLTVFKIKVDEVGDELLKRSIVDTLKLVYQKVSDNDLKFVKEQFLEFCKNQKLKNAIIESADLLSLGQYDKIKSVVDHAMKAGMERNIGHDYTEDVEKRMSVMSRNCVKTNWTEIDTIMDGGLAAGELGIITACAGAGKSWILAKLGVEAMKQGKNVVHFTLELNENYVGLRYDACFTGIDFQNIRNNVDIVKKKIADVPGKLKIKYFPIKTVSAHSLKSHCERLAILGTKVDLIIVDYADILRPSQSERNSNSYSEAGGIYEELRGVAGELQVPIWSASQSNRCHHILDTVVIDGMIQKIGDVKVGDKILTHVGYKKVTRVFPVEIQPVYKIKTKSGKEVNVSVEHRLPTSDGKLKSIMSGLSVGDKLFVKK